VKLLIFKEYLDFGFYDWVWYKDNAGLGESYIGRWLGVAHRVGNLMSYGILTEKGRVIAWTTVQRVTNLELSTTEVLQKCHCYDQRVAEILKDENHIVPHDSDILLQDWNQFPVEEDREFVEEFQNVVSDQSVPEQDDIFTPDTFDDTYMNMEIALPRGTGDHAICQSGKKITR
jgi:hypothetical protein